MKIETKSAGETFSFGEKIAADLRMGDLLLLKGDLGAGKTTLVQGIASGLKASRNPNSPSFTIMQEYFFSGGILRHIDLYRLDDPKLDADTLGLPELLSDEKAITAIEWSERLSELWQRTGRIIEIQISYGKNEGKREIKTNFEFKI